MNKKKKILFRYLLPLIVTASIFYLLYKNFDVNLFKKLLNKISLPDYIIGLFFYIIICFIRGIRFKAAGSKASILELFGIASINIIFNRILPFRTGDIVYAYILKKIGRGYFSEGLVHLVLMRLSDIVSVVTIFFIGFGLTIFIQEKAIELNIGMKLGFILLGLLALFMFIYVTKILKFILNLFENIAFRINFLKRFKERFFKLKKIMESSAILSRKRKLILFLACSFVWLSYYSLFYFILILLNIDFSFILTLVGSSFAIIASFIPLSIIGSFGLLEGGWSLGFSLCGMEQKVAIATGIIMSGLTLSYSMISFFIGAIVLLISKKLKNENLI